MKPKTFVLEKADGYGIQIVDGYYSYRKFDFKNPNGDGNKLIDALKSLKEGDRIELKIVRKRK